MPLLGFFGLLFNSGVLMWIVGIVLVWRMLGRHGGTSRPEMLRVVFSEESPMKRPENKRDRLIFRVGVFLMAMGIMNVFGALSVGEGRELRVCGDLCKMKGFAGGRFAPSGKLHDDRGDPLRACWCVGPQGSAELTQPTAPGVPPAP